MLLSVCAPRLALALDDGLPDRAETMHVTLVHEARPGCAPACAEWISAQGRILAGTGAAFDRVLRSLGKRRPPIFIDSLGGSVEEAMAIGRKIRARGLDVAVTRTAFDTCKPEPGAPCQPGSDATHAGEPRGIGAVCASSCVLILAAGSQRAAAPWTRIGVHQIIRRGTVTRTRRLYRIVTRTEDGVTSVASRTLIEEDPVSVKQVTASASHKIYDRVGAYLTEMGIGTAMMPLMLATPPSGIHWLSRDEEKTTNLVTDRVDGEYIVAKATSSDAKAQDISIPEEAFLVVAGTEPAKPQANVGRVVWRIDQRETPGTARATDVVLHADVDIPETGLKASMNISRTIGKDESLLVDVAFTLAPIGRIRSIESIGLPLATILDPAQSSTLPGGIRRSGGNAFQIRLMGGRTQMLIDRQLVEQRPWIAIPMRVDGGIAAKLALEHASSGKTLVQQAFKAWQDRSVPGRPLPMSSTVSPR